MGDIWQLVVPVRDYLSSHTWRFLYDISFSKNSQLGFQSLDNRQVTGPVYL